MSNSWNHFKVVCTHKHYVGMFCRKAGIPWQGFVHDLSKFSPIEFRESVKYFSGDRSPIDNCKDIKGYSMAWFHHRGRNKHHWEYWVDNFEKGMEPVDIPYKYAVEMLCDFLGAGCAYNQCGPDTNMLISEIAWWEKKREKVKMHPNTKAFVDMFFDDLRVTNFNLDAVLNPGHLNFLYITSHERMKTDADNLH